MKIENNTLNCLYEIAIPRAEKYDICFSPDGNYMAILMKRLQHRYSGSKNISHRLDIYKIYENDIEHLFRDQIDQEIKPIGQFYSEEHDDKFDVIKGISFIRPTLKNRKTRFLMCLGKL